MLEWLLPHLKWKRRAYEQLERVKKLEFKLEAQQREFNKTLDNWIRLSNQDPILKSILIQRTECLKRNEKPKLVELGPSEYDKLMKVVGEYLFDGRSQKTEKSVETIFGMQIVIKNKGVKVI